MSATLPSTPTERLAAIIAGLGACVAAQGHRLGLAGPLLIAIWQRLRWISARFRALAAAPRPVAHAGAAAARGAPEDDGATLPPPGHAHRKLLNGGSGERPAPKLPRARNWLVRLIPGATASLSQLEALLRDPAMTALLASDPRLGRTLRPLCWMLGVHRSLAPPPRCRKRPAPALVANAQAEPEAAIPKTGFVSQRRFSLRARNLMEVLRMGPSPYWPQLHQA